MAARVRDTQRSKLYNWERAHVQPAFRDKLSLEECQEIARQVCERYGIAVVKVKDGRGRRAACYHPSFHDIRLPLWARTLPVVLHELAHAVEDRTQKGEERAWHGPEFLRIYIDLLERYAKLSVKDLKESARAAGLKIGKQEGLKAPSLKLVKEQAALQKEIDELLKERQKLDTRIAALRQKRQELSRAIAATR